MKTIYKAFGKGSEYQGYKTEIRNFQHELQSKVSRNLCEDEKIRYRKKYRKISEGIKKKKLTRYEDEKLSNFMTDLERLLKVLKIVEKTAPTQTSSPSKSCNSETHLQDKSCNLQSQEEGFRDIEKHEIRAYATWSKPNPESASIIRASSLEKLNRKNAEEMKLKMHYHHNKSTTLQALPQIHSAVGSRNKNQDGISNTREMQFQENRKISEEIIPSTSGSSFGRNEYELNKKTKEKHKLANVDRKERTSSGGAESHPDRRADGVKFSQMKESVDASEQSRISKNHPEMESRSRYGANAGTRIAQSVMENKSEFYDSHTHSSTLASPSYSHQAPESNIRNSSDFKNYQNFEDSKEYSKYGLEDEKARQNKTIFEPPAEIEHLHEAPLDAVKEIAKELYEPDVEMQEIYEQNTIDQHGYSRNEELPTEQRRNDQMDAFRVNFQPFDNLDVQGNCQDLIHLADLVKLQAIKEKTQTSVNFQNSRRFQEDTWRTSDPQCYDPYSDAQLPKDRQDAIKMKEIQERGASFARHIHGPNSRPKEDSSAYRQELKHHVQNIDHHRTSRGTEHFHDPDLYHNYDYPEEAEQHNRTKIERARGPEHFRDPGSYHNYDYREEARPHNRTKIAENDHQRSRAAEHFHDPASYHKQDYPEEAKQHNRTKIERSRGTERFHDSGSYYNYDYPEEARPHNRTKIVEKIEEQKPLEILDVHQFFRDDFNVNSIDESLDDLSKIKILEDVAKKYEETVSQFAEEKYSIEYFVLDEKLMRLIEKLDKMKCQDDRTATDKKVQVIEYIKNLHNTLDERALED